MSSILITGGTGSLGNALVARLLRDPQWERIIVLSRDELKQSEMMTRFQADERLRFFLGDVRDRRRLREAFRGVNVVVHAAALKRVDAGSYNPGEIKRTNVDGTENVCAAAIDCGVAQVLTISSDKAVQPTNIYGASKMFAEHLTVNANAQGFPAGTRLACVRYGNVMGSRGSVVHLWRADVRAGHPLRLTDARMTRFWLTLDDACDLVEHALLALAGGEIFVPKLRAIRLTDLAAAVAGDDYPVTFTGLRPGGEKLHEALLGIHEVPRTLDCGGVYVVPPELHEWTGAQWTGARFPRTHYESDSVEFIGVEELRTMVESIT